MKGIQRILAVAIIGGLLGMSALGSTGTMAATGEQIITEAGPRSVPEKEWDKTLGGSGDDYGYSVAETSDVGYIITGQTEPYGAHSWDVWLIKVSVPDTTPPTVSSVSPEADATDVATYTTVTATFDMAMDESTITTSSFTLSNGEAVSGTVSYDSGTYTATFTPNAKLDSNTTYTATLSTAITSAGGIPLASAYSWSFTTVLVGDANQDGNLNALDITKVELIVAGLDAETPGADVNQDGSVNVLDITALERRIIIPHPPLP